MDLWLSEDCYFYGKKLSIMHVHSESAVKPKGRIMVPLELHFQMPAIRVLSSERSLLLSGRTVLPQENWKNEEERRGRRKEKKESCIV